MPLKELPAESRPREKLLTRGPQALSDAELLAIVLRTGIQGKGVLQLASELLAAPVNSHTTASTHPAAVHEPRPPASCQGGFGGISGLLHASERDLRRIKGLGPAKRAELLAVLELARRAMAERLEAGVQFESPDTVKSYLALHLAARSHEVFAVLFLDAQHRLITMEELFRGTLTQTQVYPREVVLRALHHQASTVVLAHNHPSGNVRASVADVQLTQTLKRALALVDVRVLDHFIVTQGKVTSMAEEGSI